MTPPDARQLFLCAVGRSGTTIFRTSLGKHPQIYYNGLENNIVQDVAEVGLRNCTMSSRKKQMAVSQDGYNATFRKLIDSLVWPDTEMVSRPVHLAAINPLSDQLGFLQQIYPQAKFVSLVRNGIEVVSSRMRYASFAESDFEAQCRVWIRGEKVCQWGEQNRDSHRVFRHEWFYQPERLEAELAGLFAWANLPSSPAPAEHMLTTLCHPTESDQQIARREFSRTSIEQRRAYFQAKRERWKDWNRDQRDTFCEICGPFMKHLGYEIPWSQAE